MKSDIESFTSWRTDNLLNTDGIIIASDTALEKWIPWWISNYSKYNNYPITIVDLGMSVDMRAWCEKRGEVISLNVPIDLLKNRLPLFPIKLSKKSKLRPLKRYCWFRKPFTLLQSPYRRTIWADLDCLVLGKLDALFDYANNPFKVSVGLDNRVSKIRKKLEAGVLKPGGKNFNTGVIVYQHGADLIKQWVISIIEMEGYFLGDQDIFSRLVGDLGIDLPIIPKEYNWLVPESGLNNEAVILHFLEESKNMIKLLVEDFYQKSKKMDLQ